MPIRRIRRPKDKEKLFDTVVQKEDNEGVFDTYKDLMIFAACVGFENKKRASFKQSSEQIPWTYFENSNAGPIVNAIALCDTDDVDVFGTDDESYDRKLTIFEEYANAGLEIIKDRVVDKPGNQLDGIMGLIMENEDPDGAANGEGAWKDLSAEF